MEKVDLGKALKHLYKPSAKEVVEVEAPEMRFLMADGAGDPNTSAEFREAVEALYALSYALKFMVKKTAEVDYGVMPLEGLWWTDDMSWFSVDDKSGWKWTAMIMQPEEYVTRELVEKARGQVEKKKAPPALSRVRFEPFHEGRAAQIMHRGPFSEEGPTVEKVHRFIEERGGELSGRHHEIYLKDFNRTAPENLQTVVRQPFA
ncbi:MAG: GyrI-like domain-containing protein [Rubrobacter sp.]|nr:GyrI-like domain-containing protein [Rubrobacter sp.]